MTLKELRIQKQISQQEAASFLNVPIRSYKRYETEEKYKENIKYSFLLNKLKTYKACKKEIKLMRKLKIAVAGIGYVGLSSAIVLSKKANVVLVDINAEKVKSINNHQSPINDKNFAEELKNTRITATTDIFAYKDTDIVLIATPTDLDEETNRLDTFSVESVIKTVREVNKHSLIVIRSTIPVGLTDRLISEYGENIIFVPEFLRENQALKDAYSPTRIIFGISKQNKKIEKFKYLLENCVKNGEKVSFTSTRDAEAIKLFSNAYLAMRVAFFNELDSFGMKNNLNISEVISGMGKDPRIGSDYNNPSIMFGGYCLPKDTREIQSAMTDIPNNGIISSILSSNNARLNFIADECIKRARIISNKETNNLVIGIYNLETKKVGNNYRASSSLSLLKILRAKGVKVIVFDEFYDLSERDFDAFVNKSDLIFSNKIDKKIKKYSEKLFTRALI